MEWCYHVFVKHKTKGPNDSSMLSMIVPDRYDFNDRHETPQDIVRLVRVFCPDTEDWNYRITAVICVCVCVRVLS